MSRCFMRLLLAVLLHGVLFGHALAMSSVPDDVYPELEELLGLPRASVAPASDRLKHLVDLVRSTPAGTSMAMKDRAKATGAFHAFAVRGNLERVVEYVYNPEIPIYVTMPSSVREQEWLSQNVGQALKTMSQAVRAGDGFFMRGQEREIITPDANTGGYYAYRQDRAMAVVPTDGGPVLVSVSCQPEPSDVGRKGCVVGKDGDWNYLYSEETGLTKTGLGWVDSYMYNAYSVLVYVPDAATGVVRVGSFKWLNAGWAKMNMVKQTHILNGIKRFASDFKAVLESPSLPKASELAAKYRALTQSNPETLREMVSPYVAAISQSGEGAVKSDPFKELLDSGEYLRSMSQREMVKVLLQEYLKSRIGKATMVRVSAVGDGLTVSASR